MPDHPTTTLDVPQVQPDSSRFRVSESAMGTIVIFGATGDLARRKLLPAIYNLWLADLLPRKLAVVGVGRQNLTDDNYRESMCEALKQFSRTREGMGDSCDPFISNLHYHSLNFDSADAFSALGARLDELEKNRALAHSRLYYLATAPDFFLSIIRCLGLSGMLPPNTPETWRRVVIEKPFGNDLESARHLNAEITSVLSEEQVYRIDHYLGKETVQNVFSFRFGNAIFEPLFNQKYIDHVQITVAETVGMEGRRGEFYDKTGAVRDVIQNHGLQLMCILAMEPPASFTSKEIRDEKTKVLSSVTLPDRDKIETWAVRGQYTEGSKIKGYLSEEGVAAESTTETYAALRLVVDNWRWAGVPFLIRTGKRLKARATEIAVQFKHPPMRFFEKIGVKTPEANVLVFRIQPDEAISLTFSAKAPGMEFNLLPVNMNFDYGRAFEKDLPDAYERLLLDALRGDPSLFTRADEIENAWRIVTEIRERWEGDRPPELYRPGTWGPTAADRLMEFCQGSWRQPAS